MQTEKERALVAQVLADVTAQRHRTGVEGVVSDRMLLDLWLAKCDTVAIAARVNVPEHYVYNRLCFLRGTSKR